MADYFQVKNQNIFNPPANTSLGNATNQFNDVYVQNDLVLGNVTVTGTTIIAPRVTTITYPGDDTAADTAGGQTITLTGTGFVAGASVLINGSAVGVVSVVSSTTITFVSPANATGSYVIYVINPDGSTAIAIPGIQYSGTPNWTTAAGSLGNVYETASFTQTVTATGDAPITYSVVSGSLPPGSTFNANGTITGTSQLSASPTTYSFTVRATDAEQQDTNRAFSIAVIPDVVTWSSPTDNATYTPAANIAMANITLSATSAVGSGITYSANTLPTGLSLTGANISGTPTVVANTSSLLTATANTTTESSSITINWVVSVASDPYFMYNSLLLPGTGTNGAQNNTFLDGSTNNFTITRNGNTTQGTFSPYGPNWSNYFNGSSYLESADPGIGSGSFTIEFWVNFSTVAVGYNLFVVGSTANTQLFLSTKADGTGLRFGLTGVAEWATGTFTWAAGTWYHVALVRNSTAIKIYVNGTNVTDGSPTNATSYSGVFRIAGGGVGGTNLSGYVSNLRTVKSAVYTANFTPPTSPLTAIANTALLTCQSNRFIDNSSSALTITTSGTPTVQRFSPFSPGATYSTSTIGGSGYFDGSDYLTAAADTAFDFGTGDFTIECWVYPINNGQNYPTFLASVTGWSAGASGHRYNNVGYANKFWFGLNGSAGVSGGDPFMASTNTFTSQSWYHYSITRSGNTFRMFVNGVLENTQTYSGSYNAGLGGLRSGWSTWDGGQGYFTGYLSNLRMVKGTAVYTSAFTPPTAPVTAISGTSLLLNYTNAGIIDNTMINNLETVGNAQISTAQTKFGSGSMYFDGTGDYLTLLTSPNLQFGTGDFTVELWTYFIARGANGSCFIGNYNNFTTGALALFAGHAGGNTSKYQVSYNGGSFPSIQSTTSIIYNTWAHLALVRSGTTITLYINGVADGTITSASAALNGVGSVSYIGTAGDATANYNVNGYIDDLRITKGYARYTSNFTPATSAFPTY